MKYLLTGEQMREADSFTINQIGIPSMVLMERAALKVAETMEHEKLDLSKVLILCGAGNNGGDGYAIARLLHLKGYHVEICFLGTENARSEENKKQKEIASYYQIPMIHYENDEILVNDMKKREYSVIIDAIFGTGLKREITGCYHDVISWVNTRNAVKIAVDIPSGVNDSTGTIMGIAFQADITVAIAFMKRGHILYPGADYVGKVCVADIGITCEAVSKEGILTKAYEESDLKCNYPKRLANSHKGTYGKVLLIVGSKGMSGAAYLSAKAAYAVGAGLVQIYTSEENRIVLQQLLPEAIITSYETYNEEELRKLLNWADVIGIGSGLGISECSAKIVKQTMKEAICPCIIDADALNIIAKNMEWLKDMKKKPVITPHMKEMSRLLNCSVKELLEHKFDYLMDFIHTYQVICILKDTRTWIAESNQDIYLNLSGNAAMAKAGSGDVLTGMISGIAAQNIETYAAAAIGVYLHGLAGDAAKNKKGIYSVLATDIIDGITEVLRKI